MKPEDVNKLNKQYKPVKIYKKCPKCNENKLVSNYMTKCPDCKSTLVYTKQPESNNVPKCPTCGSTNIKKISDLRKGIHAVTFGLLSTTARSQFECQNCSYK